MGASNDYNYVRVSHLEPISIEALAIVMVALYLLYLAYKRQANWDIVYFLALPFTDEQFRIGSLQPVEILSMVLIVSNFRQIRLNYVILIGCLFLLFSGIGFLTDNVHGTYSPLYSLRFLLIGLIFSIFRSHEFRIPVRVIRFIVIFSFTITFLQATLWLAGLPIHGVFYNGFFPRAKGLAHEPATWAIWVVTLFPFILHFKLGRVYLLLNFALLFLTFSTFGLIATLSFFLLRWILFGARFRLLKSTLRFVGITTILALCVVIVKPETINATSKLLTIFNKLIFYQQELLGVSTGQALATIESGEESGRGSDFTYLKENFPLHWFVGVGSFNAPYDIEGPNPVAGTNMYAIIPVELGLTGTALLFILIFQHYRVLLRSRQRKSADFMAYSLNFLLMVAGIRCFGFYEPWFAQSVLLQLAHEDKLESNEKTIAVTQPNREKIEELI